MPTNSSQSCSSICAVRARPSGKNLAIQANPWRKSVALEGAAGGDPAAPSRTLMDACNDAPPAIALLVSTPLFGCWQFRHRRHNDIGKPCFLTTLRCDAGERPCTSFVIHNSARSVDRIEQTFPFRIAPKGSAGKAQRFLGSFHDHFNRLGGWPVNFKPASNRLFSELVNGVNRIRGGMRSDLRQRFHSCERLPSITRSRMASPNEQRSRRKVSSVTSVLGGMSAKRASGGGENLGAGTFGESFVAGGGVIS